MAGFAKRWLVCQADVRHGSNCCGLLSKRWVWVHCM